ncbi:TPA: hypothetical protein SMI40_003459 [Serratia liquefaciens]|nr:hypothetical protein [Serratia liquefaciens]
MGLLKIHKLNYEGRGYFFHSPELDVHKVNIVEAPNGSGKSTFFDLLYFGLGGRVTQFIKESKETHKEITRDTSNLVEVEIVINNDKYKLIRKIGDNAITIFSEKNIIINNEEYGEVVCLNINRNSSDDVIFSDWFLERLNIPSIEIFHAGKNFKIGFTDLARLFYHNQGTETKDVYKPADNNNYVSDSSFLRKTIFEVLVGKTLVKLYDAIGVMKRKQADYESFSSLHKEYQLIVQEMNRQLGIKDVTNEFFLNKEIEDSNETISKLYERRDGILKDNIVDNSGISVTDALKREYADSESVLDELNSGVKFKEKQIDSLSMILNKTREDVVRLQKIIHTHRQLEMFTSDTCPYCLKIVDRPSDKCVCGSDVDENDYRRYFYDPSEYYSLLKSKVKSLETIDTGLKTANNDLSFLEREYEKARTKHFSLREKLSKALDNIRFITPIDILDEIDDAIIFNKENISNLTQALKLESNLQGYQIKKDRAKLELESARITVNMLQAEADQEIIIKLKDFNYHYNRFMRMSLQDCRAAEIGRDDYMPILNNGEYKEASAAVHKRFLYYLTLLQLSLLDDIPFPRLLLIDTPENIGIDDDNLKGMLSCINNLENPQNLDYQIILSTGVSKYPDDMKDNVILTLSKQDRLLKVK